MLGSFYSSLILSTNILSSSDKLALGMILKLAVLPSLDLINELFVLFGKYCVLFGLTNAVAIADVYFDKDPYNISLACKLLSYFINILFPHGFLYLRLRFYKNVEKYCYCVFFFISIFISIFNHYCALIVSFLYLF